MELYVKQKQKSIDTQMLSKFLIAESYFMYPKAKTGLLEHIQFCSYIKFTTFICKYTIYLDSASTRRTVITDAKLAKHDIKVVVDKPSSALLSIAQK